MNMNSNREGGQVLWFARTKGCQKPFNWSTVKTILHYFTLSNKCKMQGRFKTDGIKKGGVGRGAESTRDVGGEGSVF